MERERLAHITSVRSVKLVGVSGPRDIWAVFDIIWSRRRGGNGEVSFGSSRVLAQKLNMLAKERTEHLEIEVARHTKDGFDIQLDEPAREERQRRWETVSFKESATEK